MNISLCLTVRNAVFDCKVLYPFPMRSTECIARYSDLVLVRRVVMAGVLVDGLAGRQSLLAILLV